MLLSAGELVLILHLGALVLVGYYLGYYLRYLLPVPSFDHPLVLASVFVFAFLVAAPFVSALVSNQVGFSLHVSFLFVNSLIGTECL